MLYKSLIHSVIQPSHLTMGSTVDTGVRSVVILAYPGCFVGDVVKLLETLCFFNERSLIGSRVVTYVTQVYSLAGGTLVSPSTSLVKVETQAVCDYVPTGIDMLIVAHGSPDSVSSLPPPVLQWLQRTCPHARQVVALGAGVFWLAAAGLLNQRRVTTHSALAATLRVRYPAVKVESGRRLQVDGRFHTTDECINTRDIALLLLREEFFGEAFDTLGTQCALPESSFLTMLSALLIRADSITYRICVWWLGHLDQDLSMDLSARNLCMSERNFRRQFKLEVGYSPYYFLLLLRLEMARQALMDSNLPVDKVARRGGLLDGQQLARMFRKYIGVSPQQYRVNMRAGFTPHSHPDYARLFNAEARPYWLQRLLADIVVT
ncbi:helix-turn-helix domain-containing protein [Pseudomonas agarici]|uniref:GlxA family transcriptional regulator n=1 Tax=Pseudomonas agarici TaxID=46677 RepID=UPI000382E502|nr:helix-turn-helix domain-containing protein [Pseudomonas agarici]NWC07843.1 helix-turn-helix domain-containing protein [Pseudomonas agarici]SEK75902.1 Transcriptional regulator GlxA family, contains an amidase domain and an AraC-type DNA-binding HTH domain [Pseudomonas agarici]